MRQVTKPRAQWHLLSSKSLWRHWKQIYRCKGSSHNRKCGCDLTSCERKSPLSILGLNCRHFHAKLSSPTSALETWKVQIKTMTSIQIWKA
jgi:hypothetical protein